MKFEGEYIIGVKDIGKNNKITNYAILSFLEEVASTHSSTVGYGVNDIEIKKKVWLLMDWKLKVFERPKYGDKIVLKTWARPIKKHAFYTYRDFQIFLNNLYMSLLMLTHGRHITIIIQIVAQTFGLVYTFFVFIQFF